MLRRLAIRDFVIVDRLELEFESGFGALTGETGAGKSILLDALSLLLGGRAEASMIRHGCQRAELEAEFTWIADSPAPAWLAEHDIETEGDMVLLRRIIDASGRSRAQINGVTVTQAQLKAMGEFLADIHGQHAHHALLRADAQRELLDMHAGLQPLARDVTAAYRHWQTLVQARTAAEGQRAERERQLELMQWQLKELDSLGLQEGEWDELQREHGRLANVASLLDGAADAVHVLHDSDFALCGQLDRLVSRLDDLSTFDPVLADMRELLAGAAIQLDEAAHQLRRYRDRLELDPDRLGEVESRIGLATELARKHRCHPGELPARRQALQAECARLQVETDPQAMAAEEARGRQAYLAAASILSERRAAAAAALSQAVTTLMQDLALTGGEFAVALLPDEQGSAHGLERIEFQVSANPGQPLRPLAKVASGGELSRIGLAIQVITSRAMPTPTLVFDEVDVGIGGRVAEIVGRLLGQLGDGRQVLCVTHLPQVAAQAQWQWNIAKTTRDGQTLSRVTLLDEAARVNEIARMLGGVEITDTTRSHARELLAQRPR